MQNKKIIIATDSFKGSVTSYEAAQYIEEGIHVVDSESEVYKVPIADGGEGTVDSLVIGLDGQYKKIEVTGPYQKSHTAKFGIIKGDIAVIEMAEASGLHLVEEGEENILEATTYGTGELILSALDEGVTKIYIGIGGGATNDGGAGMAQALGVSLKDSQGTEIPLGAKGLKRVSTIDTSNLDSRLSDVQITILSDVTNPLCGKNGASYIYGPQKGATEKELEVLDNYLYQYGKVIEKEFGITILDRKGAGAAGGLGVALMAYCNANMKSGVEEIISLLNLEELMLDTDLLITGEGKMDNQSLHGKAPIGIAKKAKKQNIPVVAIVGSIEGNLSNVYDEGIDLVLDIITRPMLLDEAIKSTKELVKKAGETAYRAFTLNE